MESDNKASSNQQVNVVLVVRWPVGGIRTFIKYVIQNFSDKKFTFSVIGVDTEGMRALRTDIGHRVNSWIAVPSDGNEFISLFIELSRFIKNNNVDIIHSHGFTSCIASAIPSLIYRIPVVCTSHDIINESQFLGVKGRVNKWLLQLSLKNCKYVHSVSSDAEQNLQYFFPNLKKERQIVIMNGIDGSRFLKAEARSLREEIKVQDNTYILGFFGRFMGQKGFKYLVQAVEYLVRESPDFRFVVVCFGSGAFIREEKLEIVKRHLERFFIFLPFTPDVSGTMKACDAIVMPSLWEACPLQPMEALCAGVPFIGTDCIGLREVLNDSPSIVVKKADAVSLANGMKEAVISGNKQFLDYSGMAVERFDINRTVNGIREVYSRVLL